MLLDTILCIASIWALTFTIKETDGPFNIINTARLWLLRNKYVGVFFYQLLGCYFCLGAWSGVIIYFVHQHFQDIDPFDMIMWSLGGSTISFIGSLLVNKWSEK